MTKATQPVSIAGIEFDALISQDKSFEATVPEYAVESGFNISDAIILGAESLNMVLYLTDTPVTWYERHGANVGRVQSICQKLQELYYTAEPVTIITSDETFTDMAIESITISKSLEDGYARQIPISLRKVRTTQTETTTIPSSYGKSGTTEEAAGTASTTSASSYSSSSSSATTSSATTASSTTSASSYSSSSSSSSGSSSSSSSKGSILYNAASSLGFIK